MLNARHLLRQRVTVSIDPNHIELPKYSNTPSSRHVQPAESFQVKSQKSIRMTEEIQTVSMKVGDQRRDSVDFQSSSPISLRRPQSPRPGDLQNAKIEVQRRVDVERDM